MNQLVSKIGEFGNSDATRAIEKSGKWLAPWVSLLLVIGIAWQLAMLALSFFPGVDTDLPVADRSPASETSGDAPGFSLERITQANLFGVFNRTGQQQAGAAAAMPAPIDGDSDLPETSLELTLKGTIWDSNPERALAIIQNRSEENVFAVGDTVVAGARLHRVDPRQVILERNGGTYEKLVLAELADLKTTANRSRLSPGGVRRIPVSTSARANNQSNAEAVVGAMSQILRPQPHFVDQQLKGYRVYPGRQRQLFAELGLRPGDLVIDINGIPMTDPQQSAQLLSGLDQSGSMSVTVERNGTPEIITIDLDQINSAIAGMSPDEPVE